MDLSVSLPRPRPWFGSHLVETVAVPRAIIMTPPVADGSDRDASRACTFPPMHLDRASRLTFALALVLIGGLSACTDSADEPGAVSSTTSEPSTPSADPESDTSGEPAPVAEPARLVSLEDASKLNCLEPNAPGEFYSLFQEVFEAEGGDVTIDGIRALGAAVEITGSEGILLPVGTDPDLDGPGIRIGEDWPIKIGQKDSRGFDLSSRAPLRGFVVPEGRLFVPFIRFRVKDLNKSVKAEVVSSPFAELNVNYSVGDESDQVNAGIGTNIASKCP